MYKNMCERTKLHSLIFKDLFDHPPNCCIRMDEMITPTLPRVSARMWRNIPEKQKDF